MPHKHKRKDNDDSTYELPPTQIARPLPVVAMKRAKQTGKGGGKGKGKTNNSNATTADSKKPQGAKRKRGGADSKDDVPRAFKRLMAFAGGKKFRSGLDDGTRNTPSKNKKAKAANDDGAATATKEATKDTPTIQPGESMSDFARRVDAALPVMGLVNNSVRNGKDPLGAKVKRTRKERQMHKLYDEWRREEAAIQERKREEAEEAEEKELEDDSMGVKWRTDMEDAAAGRKKKGKKGKGPKSVWESGDVEDDPWEELRKKRGEKKIGLHDHVKAPPELKNKPKEVLKRVNGAAVDVGTIPKSAGSLKRREELQEVREEVVAAYRKLMEGRRARAETEAS